MPPLPPIPFSPVHRLSDSLTISHQSSTSPTALPSVPPPSSGPSSSKERGRSGREMHVAAGPSPTRTTTTCHHHFGPAEGTKRRAGSLTLYNLPSCVPMEHGYVSPRCREGGEGVDESARAGCFFALYTTLCKCRHECNRKKDSLLLYYTPRFVPRRCSLTGLSEIAPPRSLRTPWWSWVAPGRFLASY